MKNQNYLILIIFLFLLLAVPACSPPDTANYPLNLEATATKTLSFIFPTSTPEGFLNSTLIPENQEQTEGSYDAESIFIRCEPAGTGMILVESRELGVCFSIPDYLTIDAIPDSGEINIHAENQVEPGAYFIKVFSISKADLDLESIKALFTNIDGIEQLIETTTEISNRKVGVFKTFHDVPQFAFILIEQPESFVVIKMNENYFIDYQYSEDLENIWNPLMDSLTPFDPSSTTEISMDETSEEVSWTDYRFEYLGIGISVPDSWEINRQPSQIGIVQPGLDAVYSLEISNPSEYSSQTIEDLTTELEENYITSGNSSFRIETTLTGISDSVTITSGLQHCQEIFIPTAQRVIRISISPAVCDMDQVITNPLLVDIINSIIILE